MSDKLSPATVDRSVNYVVNKSGYLKRPRSRFPSEQLAELKSRLDDDGSSMPFGDPITLPVRLPSMAQRMAMYEYAGASRQEALLNFDPEGFDDHWFDEQDDLPEDGMTEYELDDSDIRRASVAARNARKAAADKLKESSATPLREKAVEASHSSEQPAAEATK